MPDARWTPFNAELGKYDSRIASGYATEEDCDEFDRLYDLKREYLFQLDDNTEAALKEESNGGTCRG